MNEHLDPGYAAAAQERLHEHARPDRVPRALWLVVGALAIGAVFGVAYGRVSSAAPNEEQLRADTLATVRDAESRSDALDGTRSELAAEVDDARTRVLQNDADGNALLGTLRGLEEAAGLDPVHGPGVTVTVTDPVARTDLSGGTSLPGGTASSARTSAAAVLDRDLQAVVNSLWVSGAEAVSVGNVRVGPAVTIRQAGGAMLVDNRPVFSPYTISAVGPPDLLQTRFTVSDAYLRMSTVAQLYGVGFTVAGADELELPPAALREVDAAQEVGAR